MNFSIRDFFVKYKQFEYSKDWKNFIDLNIIYDNNYFPSKHFID